MQVWAHYAVIPNGDREKIGEEADIDTIIEQVQTIPISQVSPVTQPQKGVDLRFAHSIRALFFAMRNTTIPAEYSNYSTHVPQGAARSAGIIFRPIGTSSPIARATLSYENVDRVNMPGDYYTMVAPYYSAERIPTDTGYHLLSYTNRLGGYGTGDALQPDGSTNFARLASVNLNIECSPTCIAQAQPLANMPANLPPWAGNRFLGTSAPPPLPKCFLAVGSTVPFGPGSLRSHHHRILPQHPALQRRQCRFPGPVATAEHALQHAAARAGSDGSGHNHWHSVDTGNGRRSTERFRSETVGTPRRAERTRSRSNATAAARSSADATMAHTDPTPASAAGVCRRRRAPSPPRWSGGTSALSRATIFFC